MRDFSARSSSRNTIPQAPKGTKVSEASFALRNRPTGFASPTEDFVEPGLDLSQLVIRHREATYFWRVEGDALNAVGIFSGDILVVDRAFPVGANQVVIAVLDGEYFIKRLLRRNDHLFLVAEETGGEPNMLEVGPDLEIWGVATHVLHRLG